MNCKNYWQKILYAIIVLNLAMLNIAQAENWYYTFKKGDTVWDFSHNSLQDWQKWDDIIQLNKISNDHYMKPGTEILIPLKWLKQRASVISVAKTTGKVFVNLANSKQKLILKPGMHVALNDEIITKENSTVQLLFEDGTKLNVLERSHLLFVTAKMLGGQSLNAIDVKAKVTQGRINVYANPLKRPNQRFIIQTLAGNSAVRGTQFRVNVNQNSTHTEVLKGNVNVNNKLGQRNIPGGYGTISQLGKKPLAPIVLLEAPKIDHLPRVVHYLPSTIKITSKKNNPKISAYRFQIYKQSQSDVLLVDKISKQGVFFSQELIDDDYVVNIRAIDQQGLEGKTAQYVMQIDARPEAPFQQQPSEGITQPAGNMSFKWSEPEQIKQFVLEVAMSQDFSDEYKQKIRVDTTQIDLNLEQVGNYFWRVSSIDKSGKIGPPSNASSLTLVPKPEQPKMEEPDIAQDQLKLKWRDAGEGMTYSIQFSRDEDFSDILDEQTVEQAQFTLKRPEGGNYYFRAKTNSPDGFSSPYSPVQKIEVPPKSYWPAAIWGGLILLLAL